MKIYFEVRGTRLLVMDQIWGFRRKSIKDVAKSLINWKDDIQLLRRGRQPVQDMKNHSLVDSEIKKLCPFGCLRNRAMNKEQCK